MTWSRLGRERLHTRSPACLLHALAAVPLCADFRVGVPPFCPLLKNKDGDHIKVLYLLGLAQFYEKNLCASRDDSVDSHQR